MSFDRFVAVDWSGAKGERHHAIAVAACDRGCGAPVVLGDGRRWSRAEVFDLIAGYADRGERVLIGIDCSFSLPFADAGGFFPGDDASPADARALWAEIAAIAAGDPHHAAQSYVERRRRHFWLGARDGVRAARARLRTVERVDAARGGTPSSCFVLLGAAQCGKASLSGMRLLHATQVPVWPFDPLPATGPVLVEIYCRVFAGLGGVRGKLRDRTSLDAALARLGSDAAPVADRFSDHVGDALVSAAGLRAVADDPALWSPAGLTADVARTEGWTFGVA